MADLKQYFYPKNLTLSKRFKIIYEIFSLNDFLVASKVGVDRTTMNRYCSGIFIPTIRMKQRIAEACNVDSSVLWEKWSEENSKIGTQGRGREETIMKFKTLFLIKGCKQQDLANYLDMDKANISRIVHGLYIPPLRIKLRICHYFNVDSSVLWR